MNENKKCQEKGGYLRERHQKSDDLNGWRWGRVETIKGRIQKSLGGKKITLGVWCALLSLYVTFTLTVSVFANICERHQLGKGSLGSAPSRYWFYIGPAVFPLFYIDYVNSERQPRQKLLENNKISFFSGDRLHKAGVVWIGALRPSKYGLGLQNEI